jgi:hypothetical protein
MCTTAKHDSLDFWQYSSFLLYDVGSPSESKGRVCMPFTSKFKYVQVTFSVKELNKEQLFQETRQFYNDMLSASNYPLRSGTKCVFTNPYASWVWWHASVIPALGRLKQEDDKFEGNLSTLVRLCLIKTKHEIKKVK